MKRPHASAAAALIAAGGGLPSEQSEPLTTEPGVPAPTQGATQTSVESSSIALTWGAPEDHGAPIENYIVEQVHGALSLPPPPLARNLLLFWLGFPDACNICSCHGTLKGTVGRGGRGSRRRSQAGGWWWARRPRTPSRPRTCSRRPPTASASPPSTERGTASPGCPASHSPPKLAHHPSRSAPPEPHPAARAASVSLLDVSVLPASACLWRQHLTG
jgi:hypothetical protein